MSLILKITKVALFLSLGFCVNAQYVFDSKKAEKLYNKLEVYYEEADYEKILDSESDIESFFTYKQDTLTALMYSFLGEAYYYGEGDLLAGIDFYEKEFELRSILTTEKDQNYIDLAFSLAALYDEAGNYDQAEKLFADLMNTLDRKKSEDYAITLLAFLDHYSFTAEADKGLQLLRKNRGSIKKGSFDEAMSLKAEGDFLEMKGEFTKAEKKYVESLDILNAEGYFPSREYINVMNALGLLYINKSQLPVAEETFEDALNILDRMGGDNQAEIDGTNFNLAQVYFEYGLYDQATTAYLEILESDKENYGDDSYSVALTQSVIGGIYFVSGDHANAEKYLLEAKVIFEALEETESLDYGRILSDLMRLYAASDRLDEAFTVGNQMLALFKDIYGDDHYSYATALSNYSDIEQRQGKLDEAEEKLKIVQKIRDRKLGDKHPMRALSLRKLAIINWKKDNLEQALEFYDKTFDNYFDQINTFFPILSEQEKSKFYYNRLKPTFEQFNSFVVEKNTENKELIGKMYDFQLATKGLILYATNKVRQSILDSNDPQLIEKYDLWISQKEQLAKLFSASELSVDVRNKRIDSLSDASNDLEKQLSQSSTTFANTFASKDVTWRDVKAKLKPGEAAVEMIRFRDFDPDSAGIYTDEVYYAGLVLRAESEYPEMVVMRNGLKMETRFLSNYRNAIKYQVIEDYSYRLFWKPLANRLEGVNKIFFSPDGVYNQISIYTLQNPDTKLFTIDEFEIQLVNNTKDLLSYDFTKKSNFNEDVYLFGFPNYNLGAVETERKKGNSTNLSDITKAVAENRGASRGARGARGARGSRGDRGERGGGKAGEIPRGIRGNLVRYMRSSTGLALLPGTKREVNLIDSLIQAKDRNAQIYMSNEALEERIKEVKAPQTLHIATHGFFLENEEGDEGKDEYVENPLLRSGLILAGANSYLAAGKISDHEIPEEDGILTAYEAMNLNLDGTELVVLSACETGLGEVQNGEGVFGLQRAFQVAGAEAIIMSMWTVDDDATQELMTNFYEEWLTTGDKHKSFITAQKRLKESRKAPYYWGAFVMVGN